MILANSERPKNLESGEKCCTFADANKMLHRQCRKAGKSRPEEVNNRPEAEGAQRKEDDMAVFYRLSQVTSPKQKGYRGRKGVRNFSARSKLTGFRVHENSLGTPVCSFSYFISVL